MENMDRIHIALSTWDLTSEYNRHTGATLLSILEHSKKPVTAHILYGNKVCTEKEKDAQYNKICYQKIADKYGCILEFHHVEIPDWVLNLPLVKRRNPGALLRLHLAELLPTVNKILYFDSDMIINTSVDLIWDTDLHETCLGACLDTDIPNFSKKRKQIYKNLKIPISTYFCSGTLLMNLERLRDALEPFTNTIYQFLSDNHQVMPLLDQELLNWYCQGNYTELPKKYNVYVWHVQDHNNCNDIVLHYAGKYKPWQIYSDEMDSYYWNYALRTPWLETTSAQIDAIRSAPNIIKALEYVQERDFFSLLRGTKHEKAKFTVKLIWSIIISCFNCLKPKK